MSRDILVVREKHGTYYYAADTPEQLYASALEILSERVFQDYWYYDPSEVGPWGADQINAANLTDEEIVALPTDAIRAQADRARTEGKRYVRSQAREQLIYDNIKQAVETRDGKLAWDCLRARSDHEYEGVELEPLNEAEVNAEV